MGTDINSDTILQLEIDSATKELGLPVDEPSACKSIYRQRIQGLLDIHSAGLWTLQLPEITRFTERLNKIHIWVEAIRKEALARGHRRDMGAIHLQVRVLETQTRVYSHMHEELLLHINGDCLDLYKDDMRSANCVWQ